MRRREAIEQGKAELNSLYQQLSEWEHDLSLRDLVVVHQPASLRGLPVEKKRDDDPHDCSPPDLGLVSRGNHNGSTVSPPWSPARFHSPPMATSKVSPSSNMKPPMVYGAGAGGSPLRSPQQQVKPIFPVFAGLDSVHNRCSKCSSYVLFFKTKCITCTRIYCNRCIKQKDALRCKCGSSNSTSSRSSSGSGTSDRMPSCWPSFLGKPRPRSKVQTTHSPSPSPQRPLRRNHGWLTP